MDSKSAGYINCVRPHLMKNASMKNVFLIAVLLTLPISSFAKYDVSLIRAQKQRMDTEISRRNKLLDEIGIPKNADTQDTFILSEINFNELSIEYALDSLEAFLLMLNNVEKEKDKLQTEKLVEKFKYSITHICEANKLQMIDLNYGTANQKIKKQIDIQIENARGACYMVRGGAFDGNKFIPIY